MNTVPDYWTMDEQRRFGFVFRGRKPMRRVVLVALMTCFVVGTAAAQSCESQAMSAGGKPLHGAAKTSFVKKCKRDACASKAMSREGKPLHGAAKNSFIAKCMRAA